MIKVKLKIFTLICFFVFNSCASESNMQSIDDRLNSLLSKMTLEEKIGQMNQYSSFWDVTGPTLPSTDEVFWSHYQDEQNAPLYTFGYGLSYTTFAYSNLKINSQTDTTIDVSVEVTNTGNVQGKEIVQLYIKDHFARPTQPIKSLKGFELIDLNPNQTKTVHFTLTETQLGFYDNDGNFTVQPGDFSIYVGGDSTT